MRLVNADFASETARIDLNAAPRELLAGLFAALGAPRAQADYYADRIIGWRSPPPQDNSPNEAANYRTAGSLWRRAARRFRTSGNSPLCSEFPRSMVERALPFLTVYSGQPQVNIFDAAPQVLAALPGMDPERLQAILVQRAGRAAKCAKAQACWRRSAPHRRSRTHKAARRCG